jgi:hypothetical protein
MGMALVSTWCSHSHALLGTWVWEWECVGVEASILKRLSRVSHASRFVLHDASDRDRFATRP